MLISAQDGLMILGCTPGQVLELCERTRTTLSEWPIEVDLRNAVVRDFLGRIDSSRRALRLAAVSAEELDVSRELQVARECLLVLNRSRRPDLSLAFRVTAETRRLTERQEELRRERIALEDGRLRSETRAVARKRSLPTCAARSDLALLGADSPVRVVYDVDAGEDIVEGSDA